MSFFDLYRKSHSNAVELLQEAELLFERGRFSRAYALAFTALDEISKSQLAADVHTGYITEQEFQKVFRDHRKKIERMAWATEYAKRYLTVPDGVYLEVEKPTFVSRNDSMYVNLKDDKTIGPSDVIGREQAEAIIHTVNVALERIMEMTEFWGYQIGTKGFMK